MFTISIPVQNNGGPFSLVCWEEAASVVRFHGDQDDVVEVRLNGKAIKSYRFNEHEDLGYDQMDDVFIYIGERLETEAPQFLNREQLHLYKTGFRKDAAFDRYLLPKYQINNKLFDNKGGEIYELYNKETNEVVFGPVSYPFPNVSDFTAEIADAYMDSITKDLLKQMISTEIVSGVRLVRDFSMVVDERCALLAKIAANRISAEISKLAAVSAVAISSALGR